MCECFNLPTDNSCLCELELKRKFAVEQSDRVMIDLMYTGCNGLIFIVLLPGINGKKTKQQLVSYFHFRICVFLVHILLLCCYSFAQI